MADAPVVHIGENSPEQIAYQLLISIAHNESKSMRSSNDGKATADRKWLLDTYAECLATVQKPENRLFRSKSQHTPSTELYSTDD